MKTKKRHNPKVVWYLIQNLTENERFPVLSSLFRSLWHEQDDHTSINPKLILIINAEKIEQRISTDPFRWPQHYRTSLFPFKIFIPFRKTARVTSV